MIKRYIVFFIQGLLCWNATALAGQSIYSRMEYANRVLIKTHHANVGMVIANRSNNNILYSKNSKQYFTTASLLKLFAASAAATLLKPDFRYTTTLYQTGFRLSHTLHGDVYLQFTGDPSLTLQDLQGLLQTLKERGVTRITGHVYLDDSAFDSVAYPPGTTIEDLAYSYASPLDAMIVDENAFEVKITRPGHNARPTLSTALLPGIASFTNHLSVNQTPLQPCEITVYSNGDNHYVFTGCLNKKLNEGTVDLAIRNIKKSVVIEIARLLKQQHIQYNNAIAFATTPKNATAIVSHHSVVLSDLIKTMLKKSDNLIANALLKTIGEHYYHRTGNWTDGVHAMQAVLTPLTHIDFSQTNIQDGAGLSRYNLLTPKQVLTLLQTINRQAVLRNTILPALPISGFDGTLKTRLHILGKKKRLHAKTGTMTGVANLAGFIRTRHHGNLAFVIMTNDFTVKCKKLEKWMDRLLQTITLNR